MQLAPLALRFAQPSLKACARPIAPLANQCDLPSDVSDVGLRVAAIGLADLETV
jgi:hypothetical protein